jgi:TolB-like protein/Tfp pilus assembly protein PilF
MGATKETGDGKGRRLDSWKAIAQFLGRDVRSVQRWEHERGLPVYRLPGQKGGAVFAYESELQQWLLSRGNDASVSSDAVPESNAIPPSGAATLPSPAQALMRPYAPWGIVAAAVTAIVVAALAIFYGRPSDLSVPASAAPRSIAVLPMQNLSGDATQEYFADGFTEELVTELAQVRSLRVISRTSTMIYKGSRKSLPEIARELHVKYVLEGSVARDGQRVRVIAQLIDAGTDTHVSARTYNADVKDLLDVQSQISRAIAGDVRLDLSPEEKTRLATAHEVDPAAHDLYLKASYAFAQQTPASIRQSLDLFKAAAAKGQSFARAYLGIAQAETALLQITAEGPEESVMREREALAKALAIDPHLGDGHGLLASLAYYHDWDWPRAEREFRIALAEGAQAPTEQRFASALFTRSRFAEATAHLQTALALDPLGKSPRVNQFFGFYFQRKYADARRELDALLAANPDFLAGHALRGLVAATEHDCAGAALQAQWTGTHFPSPLADFASALASACRGDVLAARKSLEAAVSSKGPAFASPYQLALGYASIHDKEAALRYLERSAAMHEPQLLYIKVDPLFDQIRPDPRFLALERKLGLER